MSDLPMIPQTDPRAGYRRRKAEIDAALDRMLESGRYILGEEVKAFEAEFSRFAKAKHAVGLANGTDALVVAMLALGVTVGDVVITVSHTAVATVAAVEMIGAVPMLVDIDDYYCMKIEDVEQVLDACRRTGRKVGAIIPVHIYGQPADMIALNAVAARFEVPILEDCSQAHGAELADIPVGQYGRVAAFSCYPTKNLGAIGDAGVATTNDAGIAKRLAAIRQYGWGERFVSEEIGRNSRLDEMQAAVLRVKLASLDADNNRRRAIAATYDDGLAGLALERPRRRERGKHVFHQYVVAVDDRDALKQRLAEAGIGTGIHYPVPVHRQPAYADRTELSAPSLPHTEKAAKSVLSLPMFPELADDQVQRVIDAFRHLLG